jgi:YVTN family beta-propeller protein
MSTARTRARRRGLLAPFVCLAALALASGTSLAPTRSAQAYPSQPVDSWIPWMAVDDAHRHVFLAQHSDYASNSIEVLRFDGRRVDGIGGLGDIGGMVVDGSTLYAASRHSWTIAVIDTATMEITRRIELDVQPHGLALAGGRLWFGADHNCFHESAVLSSVDPVTGEVRQYTTSHPDEVGCPILHSSPQYPDILLMADAGPSPSGLFAFDVSDGGLREIFFRPHTGPGYLLADGERVLTGTDSETMLVSLADGSKLMSYPHRGFHEWSVYNLSAEGGLVAAASFQTAARAYRYPVITTYDADTAAVRHRYVLFKCIDARRHIGVTGAAFSADGSRLFVTSYEGDTLEGQLHVYPTAPKASRVAIRAEKAGKRHVQLTARLSYAGRSDNEKLSIYSRMDNSYYGASPTFDLVARGRVDKDGVFRARAKLFGHRRPETFWAQWRGDPGSHDCTVSERVRPR